MNRCINADITLLTKSKPPHDAVLMFNEAVARKNVRLVIILISLQNLIFLIILVLAK